MDSSYKHWNNTALEYNYVLNSMTSYAAYVNNAVAYWRVTSLLPLISTLYKVTPNWKIKEAATGLLLVTSCCYHWKGGTGHSRSKSALNINQTLTLLNTMETWQTHKSHFKDSSSKTLKETEYLLSVLTKRLKMNFQGEREGPKDTGILILSLTLFTSVHCTSFMFGCNYLKTQQKRQDQLPAPSPCPETLW